MQYIDYKNVLLRGNRFPPEGNTFPYMADAQLKDFARNVRAQMERQDISTAVLAKRAGIATKSLNNVLNVRHATQFDVLEKIAKALKMEMWQLFLPEFDPEMAHDSTFPHLIQTASKLNPSGLKVIARLAELELQAQDS